jgi:hypothetical protein
MLRVVKTQSGGSSRGWTKSIVTSARFVNVRVLVPPPFGSLPDLPLPINRPGNGRKDRRLTWLTFST